MPQESIAIRLKLKTSTPLPNDPSSAAKFYEALGKAVYFWGKVETHLQLTILGIWNLPEAEPLHDRFHNEIPVSMKRRAKFWRTAFKELPGLFHLNKVAQEVMTDVMEGAQKRSILLHSAWSKFTSTDPLTAIVVSHRHRGIMLRMEQHKITLPMLHEITGSFDALNVRLLPFTWHVACLNPPTTPEKSAKGSARR